MRADPLFAPVIEGMRGAGPNGESSVVYAVDTSLHLRYYNDAWERFALENGGGKVFAEWDIGCQVMDAVPKFLHRFYAKHWGEVLRGGKMWSYDYECSSGKLYRKYRMTVHAITGRVGLLVVNSPIIEELHRRHVPAVTRARVESYRSENGYFVQCCSCRRTRRPGNGAYWDWIPQLVDRMPKNTTHGLCLTCLAVYYP